MEKYRFLCKKSSNQPSPQTKPNLANAGCSGIFGVKFWKSLRMNIPQPLYGTHSRAEKFSR